MSAEISEWTNQIHTGNCFDLLDELPENSVHAIVADGPYGLAFMGESWDDFEPLEYQRWTMRWCKKAKRVLKPGGHLLSFSGTRTYHRMASGVEDAEFEPRDMVLWAYGSGFPKTKDMAKAIDKVQGAEGEYGDLKHEQQGRSDIQRSDGSERHEGYERPWRTDQDSVERNRREYHPATNEAKRFDGFKTYLKPSFEPVLIARTPISEASIAENILQHETGALNIGACRVESGRYPTGMVLDQEAAQILDQESGERPNSQTYQDQTDGGRVGGASKFCYCTKASKAERTLYNRIENDHPTVKPIDLMTWLVKLVTADGQIVLDPFAGSGTTCKAAKESGRRFIGIEKDPEYADIARARCGLKPADPERLAGDRQSALQSFVQAEQESES